MHPRSMNKTMNPFSSHRVCLGLLVVGCLSMLNACNGPTQYERGAVVCETGDRVAAMRGWIPQGNEDEHGWEVIVTHLDLHDPRVVWRGEEYPSAASFHCGTNRLAVLFGESSGKKIRVITPPQSKPSHPLDAIQPWRSQRWDTLTTVDTGGPAKHLALSPDGSLLSWELHDPDRVRVVNASDGADRMDIALEGDRSSLRWMWAPDSSGVLTVHPRNQQAATVAWQFHPLVDGTPPPGYPTCDPGENSSTQSSCSTHGTCFADAPYDDIREALESEAPGASTRRPLSRYADNAYSGGYQGVTWQAVPNLGFPPCYRMSSALRLRMYLQNLSMAACSLDDACENYQPRTYSTRAACEAAAEAELTFNLRQLDALYQMADQARADECVRKYRKMTCEQTVADMENDPDCRAAIEFRHVATEGQACTVGLDRDGQGVHCQRSTGLRCVVGPSLSCGVCTQPLALGQACTANLNCESNLCLDGQCAAPARSGGACTLSSECAPGLVCRQGLCRGRVEHVGECRPTVDINGTTYDGDDCQLDQTCASGLCQTEEHEWDRCVAPASNPCSRGCGRGPGSYAVGTCGLLSTSLGAEQVCTLDPGDVLFNGCPRRPRLGGGAVCNHNDECETGACHAGIDDEMPGYCAAPLDEGKTCEQDKECRSGWCAEEAGTDRRVCMAPAVCQ